MRMKYFPVHVLLVALSACGARSPQLAAERTDLDDRLSCDHLQGQLAGNTTRVEELGVEAERRGRDNVGLILATGIVGLALMDSTSTHRTETDALLRRNDRLRELMTERRCFSQGSV